MQTVSPVTPSGIGARLYRAVRAAGQALRRRVSRGAIVPARSAPSQRREDSPELWMYPPF